MCIRFLKWAGEIHPPVVNVLPAACTTKRCSSEDDDFET